MIVKYKPDPSNPPRLTDKERARLDALTDDDIDFSDVPDQGDTGWTRVNLRKQPAAQANSTGKRKAHAR